MQDVKENKVKFDVTKYITESDRLTEIQIGEAMYDAGLVSYPAAIPSELYELIAWEMFYAKALSEGWNQTLDDDGHVYMIKLS